MRRTHEFYEWVRGDGPTIPLIDRGFEWLRENWPEESLSGVGRPIDVVSWGDSRPGNVIYRDFEPVALLDWEMASVGPRELDLGWIIFLHRFFQDLAEVATLPGLPDFCKREDIAAEYAALTGHHAADLTSTPRTRHCSTPSSWRGSRCAPWPSGRRRCRTTPMT